MRLGVSHRARLGQGNLLGAVASLRSRPWPGLRAVQLWSGLGGECFFVVAGQGMGRGNGGGDVQVGEGRVLPSNNGTTQAIQPAVIVGRNRQEQSGR